MTDSPTAGENAAFDPATPRPRHDGWTAERQVAFIEALGECGCVEDACRRVGMGTSAAYALRRRPEAQSFRRAWDAALDHAIDRLSDAAFSRAINGVARPVFFQGQQIGERRYYDERLTQFLLRYRDPVRYGAWLDDREARRHPDGAAIALALMVNRVARDAHLRDDDDPAPPRPIPPLRLHLSDAEVAEEEERAAEARRAAAQDALDRGRQREFQAAMAAACSDLRDGPPDADADDEDWLDDEAPGDGPPPPGEEKDPDVVSGSSGSAARTPPPPPPPPRPAAPFPRASGPSPAPRGGGPGFRSP